MRPSPALTAPDAPSLPTMLQAATRPGYRRARRAYQAPRRPVSAASWPRIGRRTFSGVNTFIIYRQTFLGPSPNIQRIGHLPIRHHKSPRGRHVPKSSVSRQPARPPCAAAAV